VTWSQMTTIQRAACVVLLPFALIAYGLVKVVVEGCDAVGLE
jgi:hypothetical protein